MPAKVMIMRRDGARSTERNLFAQLTGSTSMAASPQLSVVGRHNAAFHKGEIGTYMIVVSNTGKAATSGPVNVAVKLPAGLTYQGFNGSGWTFNKSTLTFTQKSSLPAGETFPTLAVEVKVAKNAPHSVNTTITASGGKVSLNYSGSNDLPVTSESNNIPQSSRLRDFLILMITVYIISSMNAINHRNKQIIQNNLRIVSKFALNDLFSLKVVKENNVLH